MNCRKIVDFNFHQAHFRGPAGNAVIQRSAKEVRKNRYNVGLHLRNQKPFTHSADTETRAKLQLILASSFALLLLLLFCGHRRINFQQALGKLHAHLFALVSTASRYASANGTSNFLPVLLATISSGASPAPN